jgi:hypothetical protein
MNTTRFRRRAPAVRLSFAQVLCCLFALVLTASCGPNVGTRMTQAARDAGIFDQEQRALDIRIVCDASQYSTCTAETLRATLRDLVLPAAAARPGSHVRLYTLGEDVTARHVASATSTPATRPTPKLIAKHEQEWADETLRLLMTAAAPLFDGAPAQRSRIAEALTRISASDDVPDAATMLIYAGDLRETGVAKFECATLPSTEEWLSRLDRSGLLAAESMKGMRVLFLHASITNPLSVQCDSAARSLAIRQLWRDAITRAGGIPSFYDTQPEHF